RMRSLAAASALLSRCINVDGASSLLAELGFSANAVPLTADSAAGLALPENAGDVRITSGEGALRALVFSADSSALRETVARAASSLNARAPQLLFLIVAIDISNRKVVIAAFDNVQSRPRVSALVVD